MASELAVVAAARAAILADATLSAAFGGRVFMTWMRDTAEYPLLTITHSAVRPDRTYGTKAEQFSLYVDVWARWGADEDPANVWVREQAGAVEDLLDEPSLDLDPYALIHMRSQGRLPLADPSSNIERSRVTFSVSVQCP